MEAKVPRAAVWKLKTQMCWWNSSSLSLNGWEPGKLSIVPGQRLAGLRSRKSQCFSESLKARGKKQCPISKTFREEDSSYPWQGYPFSYIQSFSWLDKDRPHWGKQSAWVSLLIQMIISSRNSLTDILRIVFDQMSGDPHGPVRLTLKINHHILQDPLLLVI